MDPDDAMRWLEQLAAQQGANPEELITQRAAEPVAMPEPVAAVSTPAAEPDFATMDPDDAMRWLEQLAAQQGANPDELITKPEERIAQPPAWIAPEPIAEVVAEPVAEAPAALPSEADIASMSPDDAMRWLEQLAAQQGANPDELITTADERATVSAPPTWAVVEPETPSGAEAPTAMPSEADIASMSSDDAMRWLEQLAAQQGASPDELITQPEERLAEPPTWVATETAPEPVAEPATDMPDWMKAIAADTSEPATPLVVQAAELPATPVEIKTPLPEPERPKTAPIAQAEPPPAPEPTPESPAPAEGAQSKLARLAEQLASKRRAKDEDIARRFEEQRAEKEAARREIQERLEQKRRPGTGPLTLRPGTGGIERPGTGGITRPGTGGITRPGTGGIARPGTGALSLPPSEEEATLAAVVAPPPVYTPRPPKRQASAPRPKKARASKSPYAAQPPDQVFALAQQRLTDQDFPGAAEAFTYLISSGQYVDETLTELETFIRIRPEAIELWQVLGDAYMRVNRLQKALDAYRQALGQL
jgi:hypothetical protein